MNLPSSAAGSMVISVVNARLPMFFVVCASLVCASSNYVATSNSIAFASVDEVLQVGVDDWMVMIVIEMVMIGDDGD